MRPARHGSPPVDDLTARARIRDASLELFGERGYRGTSIRDIARRAGVSPGLIQHHFGPKDELRNACDRHVLETLQDNARRKIEREHFDADFVSELYEATLPILRYIARGWAEGWPASARLFDLVTEATMEWMLKVWPDRYTPGSATLRRHAATMVSMNFRPIVLHEHLAPWVGAGPLGRAQHYRTGRAMLEIYTAMGEFIASEAGAQRQRGFSRILEAYGGFRCGGGAGRLTLEGTGSACGGVPCSPRY